MTLLQKGGTSTAVSSTDVALTVVSTLAGSLLFVLMGNDSTRDYSAAGSVFDNQSNTYTRATNAAGINGANETDIWYCLNPIAGVTSITARHSGAATTSTKNIWAFEVQADPGWTWTFDVANNIAATGSGTTDTGAAVTSASTGFIGSCCITPTAIVSMLAGNEFTLGVIPASSNASAFRLGAGNGPHIPAYTESGSGSAYVSSTAAIKMSPPTTRTTYKRMAPQQRYA